MNNCRNKVIFGLILLLCLSCKTEIDITPRSPTINIPGESTGKLASVVSLINNLKSGTVKTYELGSLDLNAVYYTDRTYKITSIPEWGSSLTFIRTACDDKTNKTNLGITFTLNQDATIYVAYDPRATVLPAWLNNWKKLPDKIGVTDAVGYLDLYSKDFTAGNVTLGSNMAAPSKGVSCNYFAAIKANTLMVGANGHSLGLPPYTATSAVQQIAMLRKMGMRGYRQDVLLNTDGSMPSAATFSKLYQAATDSGITILPMISAQTINFDKTEAQMYTVGKLYGVNVATKNSKYFKYYELGNELDNLVILPGKDGNKTTDYDATKFKKAASYLKGMDVGIKSVQPTAQTMVNAGWLHYAFLQMLESYGVNFDIIAYHWYSDMEGAAKGKNIPDITLKLSGLFTKPIWFTEAGQRYKNVADLEQLQSDFTQGFIAKCRANPQVKAVLFYELFDEPDRSDAEGHFGLIKWVVPYSKWDYKKVATNLFIY